MKLISIVFESLRKWKTNSFDWKLVERTEFCKREVEFGMKNKVFIKLLLNFN